MLFIIHVLRIANEWNKENLKDKELYLHWNKYLHLYFQYYKLSHIKRSKISRSGLLNVFITRFTASKTCQQNKIIATSWVSF